MTDRNCTTQNPPKQVKKRTKYNTKTFIAKSIKVHGNRFSYKKTEYKSARDKIVITCPEHGDFVQVAMSHIRGYGCRKCGFDKLKLSQSEFVSKSLIIHGGKFDYSKSVYKTNKDKVVITCPIHGDFTQTPASHIKGGGCKECGIKTVSESQTLTKNDFLQKSFDMHGSRYIYDNVNYTLSKNKVVITCREHGDFEQIAYNHYNGQGCPLCGVKTRCRSHKYTTSDFIDLSIKKHGDKYLYGKAEYVSSSNHVIITCKKHGDFKQYPSHHIRGHGCPKCHYEVSGYSRSDFKGFCDRGNGGIGELYVLKCQKGKECFYKIGITSTGVKARFPSKRAMPYDFDVIYTIQGHPDYIYDIENRLHSLLKSVRHTPKLQFKGYTECFSTIKPVLKLLTELSGSKQIQLLA